jgi:hypothetical protein
MTINFTASTSCCCRRRSWSRSTFTSFRYQERERKVGGKGKSGRQEKLRKETVKEKDNQEDKILEEGS